MAVTQDNPSITASIVVNGVALQEYDDDEGQAESTAVTKYVEAITGAEFAIQYRFDKKPKHHVRVNFLLDGKDVAGQYAFPEDFKESSLVQTSYGVMSNEGSKWQMQNYAFADLQTVDSEGKSVGDQLVKDLKHMGQITVEFHYVTSPLPSSSSSALVNYKPMDKGLKDIPEKALKGRALSHQSTLRAPKPTKANKIVATDYLDPKKTPFATYHFKYRSRDALKALTVIPRSPSPMPLEDRDVDTLTAEEMRQLLRRQRDRERAAQEVKQERGVKRERSRERSRTAFEFNGDDEELSFVSAKRSRHPVIIDEDGAETIDLT